MVFIDGKGKAMNLYLGCLIANQYCLRVSDNVSNCPLFVLVLNSDGWLFGKKAVLRENRTSRCLYAQYGATASRWFRKMTGSGKNVKRALFFSASMIP